MDYEFPFDVPEDLTTLSAENLAALDVQVKEHAKTVLADDGAGLEAVDATHSLLSRIKDQKAVLTAAAGKRDALSAALVDDETDEGPDDESDDDGNGDDDGTEDGDGTADEAEEEIEEKVPAGAVAASKGAAKPSTKAVAKRAPKAKDNLPNQEAPAFATMVAAADVPDFVSGAKLTSFGEAASAVESRMGSYPSGNGGQRNGPRDPARKGTNIVHPVDVRGANGELHRMKTPIRHGAVKFNRQFPDDQRILSDDRSYEKVLSVASEKRLPGGSLVASAEILVKQGRALTAAVGWCAPSETIHNLCELESMDGILDLPEIQANRGGFNIPEDGGPDFSSIWTSLGAAGNVILSEYDVINDELKVCTEIPCPDFIDVRLDVAYACLTGSLLQRRGYPEIVERFSRGAMVALAHKINEAVIASIVAAAGAATVIPSDPQGDDAASALLSAVELGIVDMKYRNRMPFASTLEVVLPMWVIQPIRAGLARRNGVDMLGVTDAMILRWFADRGAVPRFVYDWQDALTGLVGGPGGAVAITELPDTVDFVIYPAGTFTKAVADVVTLDTVYDAASLANNQYTALFTEDGFAVLQTCPDVRQYTASVDPSGCVGCGGNAASAS